MSERDYPHKKHKKVANQEKHPDSNTTKYLNSKRTKVSMPNSKD